MQDFVVDILQQEQLPTKSLEQVTVGRTFFQMCISLSEVSPVSGIHREAKDESFALKANIAQSPFPTVAV